MPELIALSVFIAVTASAFALLSAPRGRVQRRLASFREMTVVIEDAREPEPPFMERIGRPVLNAVRHAAATVLPAGLRETLRRRLTLAGDPISLSGLFALWAGATLFLPGSYLLLIALGGAALGSRSLLALLVLLVLGVYLPHLWLKRKMKTRQKRLLTSLPDAIDLLTTSVEAGLGIDAALGQVAEKVRGPISVELRRVLREMAMGAARKDALAEFAARTQVPDVQLFVNAIVQAEQMGVNLGQVIRVQADQMRVKCRQRAEQQAYKAPVKMVFPLALFIFPSIFVVVLGPAVISILDGGF